MITSADIRRILSKRQGSTPADDFRIIDSWVEYENSGSFADKSSEKRKLNYMCYELEVLNPVTGEKEHLFKALKFCRVIRLPKSAKESKTFMDMHTQVLTGVWENQINFVTVIANIMEPVALGLLFLYGVQGIGRDIQEAKEIAHNDFLSFIGSLQGTYKVLELSTLTAEESEWLREKMYGMEYLTVVRGIPKAHNQGVDVSKSSGMDGKIANPEGQGTLEEIIIGMTDYEYVIEILSTPVYTDTLKHWSQRTESDMTDWYGQLQGTKGYSFNLSIPMMYLANQSTSSGWSQAYTDAESVSYTESETFSTAFGESAGTALSESYGTSIGHSEGISNSESVSFSSTTTTGETVGETVGTTIGESVGTTVGNSVGTTIGNSVGTSQGISNGNTVGHSVGNGTSHTVGSSLGESFGTSHSVSVSNGESETHSLGTSTSWSHSTGESFGESETSSEGFSQNQSFSRGESSGTSSNASFGASENWSEGTSSGHSNGISTGSSTSNSETSSDSISTSESTSQTHSDTHSNSTSVGNSVGTSHSDSQGASNTVTSGKTQGTSSGTNYSSSHTVTNGTSSTVSESHGTSHSTGASNGTSNSTGTSDSAGTSDGWSQNSGSTQSTSSSHSVGTGTSHSSGSSDGGSVSSGSSDSTGSSAGGSTGTSSSQTQSTGQSGSTSQNTSTGSSSSSVTSQGNNTSVGASAMGINVGGSTSNSASNSQGASSSVGSGTSQGSSTSTGTSEGVSSSTTATDSSSHSTTNSSSVSHTNSTTDGTSTSNSNTTGSSNSLSQTSGVSGSTNQSHSTNASSGTSQSVSTSTGTSQSTSHSMGQSQSTSNGFSSGSSFSTSQSVSSSESIGASINRGDTTSETSSITNGESTGSSDGYSVTQGESKGHTTGSSIGYGTSNSSSESFSSTSSSSMGGGYSTSVGSGSSQSVSSSASEGFGSSSSTSFGKTHTTSSTDSVGGGTSESYSWGKSHTTSESDGTSHSTSTSTSVSDGTSKNYSDSFSTSTSNSSSTSQSQSQSQSNSSSVSQSNSSSVAHSNSSSVAHSTSLSNGTSRGTSTGNSSSDSTSESKSHGTTESTGTSKTISNGASKGTSKGISRGESIGTSGAYASGTASSMGLGPSIGYSKSYQWVDQQVKDIIELLEFQNQRIKKALRGEGAMYTYVYIACSSMDALSTAKATAKSAWQNEFALTNPLQVIDLTEQEQNHLLYHFSAFSSDVTRENVAGAQEYKYATVLLPGELTAYTHLPRISEGGIYANVEDIPKFAVPSMMRGEIYLGTVLSTERYSFNNGYSTPFDYKFDEASLMHGIFSGASRSGKTVAALRFAAELSRVRRKSTGKRLRLICMDPKTDWRALAHYVEPERFKFYSLGDINFHPIKLNPWKIPKGVWPQLWIDGVIDIYCRAYGLLERGKQMMGETIYALYEEAGVFKACDKEDWRETTPELSKQVTFAAIYARMSKIKLDLEDPNNKKGRAGNDTRDAYARLLDRLQAFGREFSIERRLFSSKDGMGVDDLIGEDDVVVLESSGLESTFSNFIFGVITSGFYKYAKAHEKGFLSKDQYETVFFIEEANKVLIGSDSADRSGGGNMGLSGQSEFEEILDQAAGWGLFIFAVTQLIAAMPSSVIANVGLLFAGRQGRVDDTTVVVRKIAREERIDDRDMVKWFPKAPIGWFVCQSTRGYNFKDAEPVLVKIAPLNNPSPTNDELDEILVQRKVMQAIKEAQ